MDQEKRPQRKQLGHEVPSWVQEDTTFFITICCEKRGHNYLALHEIAYTIKESAAYRQKLKQWWIHYLLLMPDHVHMLVSFGDQYLMSNVIASWKRFLSRNTPIKWQRDFFDHRIRSENSFAEKWNYIANNPVRKGLVTKPEEWPFSWDRRHFQQ